MNQYLMAIAGVVLLWSGCAVAEQTFTLTPEQRDALGVTVVAPVSATHYREGPFPASVVVPNAGIRRFQAALMATVTEVLVTPGQQVEVGDPLLVLSGAEVVAAQQQLVLATQELAIAVQKLKADEDLFKRGGITERRLLETRAAHGEARARRLAAQSDLQVMGVAATAVDNIIEQGQPVAELPITAPMDGLITEQWVVPGSRVAIGDHLLEMISAQQLQLEIHMPAERCGAHLRGRRVLVNDVSVSGRVLAVGCTIHQEDQGVLVRATLETRGSLKPGQLVDVSIVTPFDAPSVWRIPPTGLTRHNDGNWVFLAQGSDFLPVAVTVLRQTGDEVYVSTSHPRFESLAATGAIALKAVWLGAGGEE